MILKKPYAFLIKRFRIIHLILTFLIGYLLSKSIHIYNFFNRYVSNIYATLSDAIPSNYITIFMFLVAILIITFSLAIYLLMKNKEKPRLLYIWLCVYYLIYFCSLIAFFILFKRMESYSISIRSAMVLRDLNIIVIIPQIIFLFYTLIRAVGFDIKKFNFSRDLKELDLTEKDSEEFEFILGVDSYKYMRFLRRRLREFKYYVLENKFMFMILSGLIIIILVIMVITHYTVYNRIYNANQKINANNLIIEVNNSYLTNLDYTGKKIAKDKYYLIINTTFTNTSGLTTVLNLSSYELKTKTSKVYPTLTRNDYFIDLGSGYNKERIENDTSSTYILVYELDKSQLDDKYTLRIIDEIEYKAGTINAKTKIVNIKPNIYLKTNFVNSYDLKDEITFYESILNNSSIKINSYSTTNKYIYQFEACIRSNCQNKTEIVSADATKDKTLLILDGYVELDENSTFAKNAKTTLSFFDAFVQIKYDDNVSKVSDLTPKSFVDKYVLQVDSDLSKASSIELVISIRDKEYIIKLK